MQVIQSDVFNFCLFIGTLLILLRHLVLLVTIEELLSFDLNPLLGVHWQSLSVLENLL